MDDAAPTADEYRAVASAAERIVVPLGMGTSVRAELAEVLKIIDASSLAYQRTPSGTCMDGGWDDIMRVVRQCHDHARGVSAHVLATITIEDERGGQDKLTSNVASLVDKVGRKLKRVGATVWP